MSDLAVTDADIETAVSRLQQAAVPVGDLACAAPGVAGSDAVASAIGEADSLVRRMLDALSGSAEATRSDTALIGTTLGETDQTLAGGTP